MRKFKRRIEAAVDYLNADQPVEAENEIKLINPRFRRRSEVLLIGYEISATLGEWKQAKRLARILCRRYPDKPGIILLLAEAMRSEDKSWELGSVLDAAEKRFLYNIEIQHHLLRHDIVYDAPQVALKRIQCLIDRDPWWLSTVLEDAEIAALLPTLVAARRT